MTEDKFQKVYDLVTDYNNNKIDNVDLIYLIDDIYKETPMYAVTNYIRLISLHEDEQEANKEAERLKCEICKHNEIKVYKVIK